MSIFLPEKFGMAWQNDYFCGRKSASVDFRRLRAAFFCGREFYVQIFASKSLKFELTEQNKLLKSTFDMLITNTIQK